MLLKIVMVFALGLLAACGGGSTTTSGGTSAPRSTVTSLTPAEITTAMAKLPAPYNTADYTAGRGVFAQCRSCHVIEAGAGNRVGPNLHGIVGRRVATEAGFTYSDALKNANFSWDADHLDHWLAGPQAYLPGTRMAFIGVRDETQRRNLIAYLMVESAR